MLLQRASAGCEIFTQYNRFNKVIRNFTLGYAFYKLQDFLGIRKNQQNKKKRIDAPSRV